MRLLSIFLILYLTSCTQDNNKVDLNSFLKLGKKMDLVTNNDSSLINKKVFKIIKINNKKNNNPNIWSQSYLNSQNFIPNGNLDLDKVKKKISLKIDKIIFFKNKIAAIDLNSNIYLMDQDLKILLKKKIYKKKIFDKYKLKFSLIFLNNNLIVSDNLGNLNAFNSNTLDKVWSSKLSSPFMSEMKILKDNFYLINSNSKIFSINSKNGEINWSFETSSKIVKDQKSYQIVISNNNLIFSNDYAEIFCIDLDKKNLKWSINLEKSNFNKIPFVFNSSPFLTHDNNLYFSSNYGYVYSIDIENGNINWFKNISSNNKIYIYDNKIFITHNKNLSILEKNSGNFLYNNNFSSLFKKNNSFYIQDLFIGKTYIYLFFNNGKIIKIYKNNLQKILISEFSSSFSDYIFFKDTFLILNKESLILF